MRKIRNDKQLVNSLRKSRIEAELSQKDLAEETGLSQQAIARMEAGKVSPTLATIFKVIAALDLELTIEARNGGV